MKIKLFVYLLILTVTNVNLSIADDCNKFELAKDIDPEYCELLEKAVKKNLNILCYDCKFLTKGIKLNRKVKFKIK